MKRNPPVHSDSAQLGFDDLLIEAEAVNKAAALEREFGHLPATMEDALPFYRDLIDRHHAAMLAADLVTVMRLRKEAHDLARRLNIGEPGILAGPDAPGCMLETLTAAEPETIPLWGQTGSFMVEVQSVRVRIEMDGIFGVGACYMPWPNFSAHAVDWDRPFISETGYRSFMGLNAALEPDLTAETFAIRVLEAHIGRSLKGRMVAIEPRKSKK
jgi:hypothetical protein